MKKYSVTYYEMYCRTYEVEANSKEEAEEILINDIGEGRENPPKECCGSKCETKEIE